MLYQQYGSWNTPKLWFAKLGAYGFETNGLRYMKSRLTNRIQRVRVNKTFNEWERITTAVPQGSILGPLLFNIFKRFFLFQTLPYVIMRMTIHSTPSDTSWKRSRIIYETVLIRCTNGFTKIIWYLMQENVICVLGITLKTKHSYSTTSLWKIAKNRNFSVL